MIPKTDEHRSPSKRPPTNRPVTNGPTGSNRQGTWVGTLRNA